MLLKNPTERISIKDIKNHPFFKEINWEMVYNK